MMDKLKQLKQDVIQEFKNPNAANDFHLEDAHEIEHNRKWKAFFDDEFHWREEGRKADKLLDGLSSYKELVNLTKTQNWQENQQVQLKLYNVMKEPKVKFQACFMNDKSVRKCFLDAPNDNEAKKCKDKAD